MSRWGKYNSHSQRVICSLSSSIAELFCWRNCAAQIHPMPSTFISYALMLRVEYLVFTRMKMKKYASDMCGRTGRYWHQCINEDICRQVPMFNKFSYDTFVRNSESYVILKATIFLPVIIDFRNFIIVRFNHFTIDHNVSCIISEPRNLRNFSTILLNINTYRPTFASYICNANLCAANKQRKLSVSLCESFSTPTLCTVRREAELAQRAFL